VGNNLKTIGILDFTIVVEKICGDDDETFG
jgi:hypothetical protein